MENKADHFRNWLTLLFTPGLGPRNLRRLLEMFGSPAGILAAGPKVLAELPGFQQRTAEAIADRAALSAADRELKLLAASDATLVTWDDPRYPELLRNLPDAPVLLYARGDHGLLNQPAVAVVGSRAATSYGLGIAHDLAAQLAREQVVIISGFALGIDTAAHLGALEAAGGTVAVLGCGIDVVYPAQNRKLFDRIAAAGLLLSEYPFGTKPEAFRFPARNRIISGLAHGVVVVEAARHSGSLITARLALDYGREVFAVPGRVDSPKSAGTHRLLQEGAKLVHSLEDILEELPFSRRKPASGGGGGGSAAPVQPEELTGEENGLLAMLEVYPKMVDEIIAKANLPARKVNELLLTLELKGLIEALPGNHYQRKTSR